MTPEFKRLVEAARDYHNGPPHDDVFVRITRQILDAIKEPTPGMIKAAIETPWPDGMTGDQQIRAMLVAAIDSITEV